VVGAVKRRDRLALIFCIVAVGLSVFIIGGAERWGQALVGLSGAGALLTVLLSRRRFDGKPILLIALFTAIGWTAFQCIPLPDGLVSSLSPTLDAIRDDGLKLVGATAPSTLSMDLSASLRVLAMLLALSSIAYVALWLAGSEKGRYALISSVAGIAIIAGVVSAAHKLFDAHSLYGLYTPHQSSTPIMGPLLNPNHLGCLMAVGAILSTALTFYRKQTSVRRALWAVGACTCLAVTMATLSRGAAIGLAIGVFVLLASLFLQKAAQTRGSHSRRERFLSTTLPIGVIVVCSLALSIYVGAGGVVQQLENTSFREVSSPNSKFAAWRSSTELVEESPWVGVGRGAFEAVFPRVHPGSGFTIFSHPENEPVEWVVEWGVPATLVLFAMIGWMLFVCFRRWRDGPLAAGAMGALAAVAFQSNFDFGIELLGIAAPIIVVAATLSYVPVVEMSARRLPSSRLFRGIHVAAVLAGVVLLLSPVTTTLEEDHLAVYAAPSMDRVIAAIGRHPMDYFGYAILAEQRVHENATDAVNVLNHALRLHPSHSGLHLIAARLLARVGRLPQAGAEYSTALRHTWNQHQIIEELIKVLPAQGVPDALPLSLEVEPTVRILVDSNRADLAMAWLQQVVTYAPRIDAAQTLYSLASKQRDLGAAEHSARVWCRLARSSQCELALARVLDQESKPADVVSTLGDVGHWQGLQRDQVEAWLMVCDAHLKLDQLDEARKCLERLETSGLNVSQTNIEARRLKLQHVSTNPTMSKP